LDEAEAAGFRKRFQDYWDQREVGLKGLLQRDRRNAFTDLHLCSLWVYSLVSHPLVLDAVESILGPNLLVWSAQWFPKLPGEKAYVSWHQDGTYWGLNPPSVTTAWIAVSESNRENGCMRVVPRTHKTPLLPQRDTYAANNMLSRGQEIAVEVDEKQAVDLVLRPGEMSLHHIGIVHGSGPNNSQGPRIGLAVRYIVPEVTQSGKERDIAVLVRGKDDYGHFELVKPPERDEIPEESAVLAEARRRRTANILPDQKPQPN
jgi:ectoine hydroxylase-related dioxygenase (phytanoyl-CoA dioxygenase family)